MSQASRTSTGSCRTHEVLAATPWPLGTAGQRSRQRCSLCAADNHHGRAQGSVLGQVAEQARQLHFGRRYKATTRVVNICCPCATPLLVFGKYNINQCTEQRLNSMPQALSLLERCLWLGLTNFCKLDLLCRTQDTSSSRVCCDQWAASVMKATWQRAPAAPGITRRTSTTLAAVSTSCYFPCPMQRRGMQKRMGSLSSPASRQWTWP